MRDALEGKVQSVISMSHEQTAAVMMGHVESFYSLANYWFRRLEGIFSGVNDALTDNLRLLAEVNPVKPVLEFSHGKRKIMLYIRSAFNYLPYFTISELASHGVDTNGAAQNGKERLYFVEGSFSPEGVSFGNVRRVEELNLDPTLDVSATMNIAAFRRLHPDANVFYLSGDRLVPPDMLLDYASRDINAWYPDEMKKKPAGGNITPLKDTVMKVMSGKHGIPLLAGLPNIPQPGVQAHGLPAYFPQKLLGGASKECAGCSISDICIDYEVRRAPLSTNPFPHIPLRDTYLNRR